MNNTSGPLPVYTSLRALSTLLQDIINGCLLPSICIVGCITNIMCLVVLSSKNLAGKMYEFLTLMVICDLLKLLLSFGLVIFRCGALCPYGYNFYAKLYEQYIFLYWSNVWNMYGSLIHITAASDRLLSFYPYLARKVDKLLPLKVRYVILFIFASAWNVPEYIITRSTAQTGWLLYDNPSNISTNSTQKQYEPIFNVVSNNLSKILIVKNALFVIAIIRKLFLLVVLMILNALVVIKFHQHLSKKRSLTSRSSISRTTEHSQELSRIRQKSVIEINPNTIQTIKKTSMSNTTATKMITVMSVSCFLCNIQDAFSSILFIMIDTNSYNFYLLTSNFTLLLFRACNVLLFYIYIVQFRNIFRKIFCCAKNGFINSSLTGAVSTKM